MWLQLSIVDPTRIQILPVHCRNKSKLLPPFNHAHIVLFRVKFGSPGEYFIPHGKFLPCRLQNVCDELWFFNVSDCVLHRSCEHLFQDVISLAQLTGTNHLGRSIFTRLILQHLDKSTKVHVHMLPIIL